MFNLTKLDLLWDWVSDLKKKVGPSGENLLPSRSAATTGQILKLTGENKTPSWDDEYSYIPPAYSETEVNTGQKWIDGKYIYCVVITGTIPETGGLIATVLFDSVISYDLCCIVGTNIYFATNRIIANNLNGQFTAEGISTAFADRPYNFVLYYTKPDPVPGDAKGPEVVGETPDEMKELEAEEKKTTKKKTSK